MRIDGVAAIRNQWRRGSAYARSSTFEEPEHDYAPEYRSAARELYRRQPLAQESIGGDRREQGLERYDQVGDAGRKEREAHVVEPEASHRGDRGLGRLPTFP